MYAKQLEKRLSVEEAMAQLEAEFDMFGRAHEWPGDVHPKELLQQIKYFLHKNKKTRKKILENTRLDGTDCITMSVLGVLLARRKGLKAQVGTPKSIVRMGLHTLIVYPDGKQKKLFRMAGKTEHKTARILNPSQVDGRLRFTAPINRVKTVVKPYIRRRK